VSGTLPYEEGGTLKTAAVGETRPTVKGTAFRGYRKYLDTKLDDASRAELLASLEPRVRTLVEGDGLLVSSMYPIEYQHRFLEAFAALVGDEAPARLHAMGVVVAETDLGGVYRMFIWAASVPRTLQVLSKVWNNYFSTGHATWHPEGPGDGTMLIKDRHQHPLHHPIVSGYIETAMRLAGGKKGLVDRVEAKGDTVSFHCTWRG
jgi:uncharacterized protein (TIGR02265 family)